MYPVSPEIADLFHAHVGDPDAKTEMKWDSPSGRVYSWRWEIGRDNKAFYATVIRKRPTFVTWPLVPSILRLMAELRTPDELFDFGVISNDAYRIAQVLDGVAEPLNTAQIREKAGFNRGSKEQSNAYHKGLAELENRLLVTTEFGTSDGEGSKHHGLMFERRPDDVRSASELSFEQALDTVMEAYAPAARYVNIKVLARHLGIAQADIRGSCERLATQGLLHEDPKLEAGDFRFVG